MEAGSFTVASINAVPALGCVPGRVSASRPAQACAGGACYRNTTSSTLTRTLAAAPSATSRGRQEARRFVGHTSTIERGLAFSADSRYLASGSFDRTARIWDVASGQEIRRLAGYGDVVGRVAFTPDGRLLLTISADGIVSMTYVRLEDAVDDLCRRLIRDFLPEERDRYNITGSGPTCPAR